MLGIAQTKKVLLSAMTLAVEVIKVAKDGIQLADVSTLLNSEPVKASVADLFVAIKDVPAELGDITLAEGIELAMAAASKVPDLIGALSK